MADWWDGWGDWMVDEHFIGGWWSLAGISFFAKVRRGDWGPTKYTFWGLRLASGLGEGGASKSDKESIDWDWDWEGAIFGVE